MQLVCMISSLVTYIDSLSCFASTADQPDEPLIQTQVQTFWISHLLTKCIYLYSIVHAPIEGTFKQELNCIKYCDHCLCETQLRVGTQLQSQ